MEKLKLQISVLSLIAFTFLGCKKDSPGVNLFSLEDDKELGLQLKNEIESNPSEYPLLDSVLYADVYQYLYDMRDKILASDEILYKDEFSWELKIIDDDQTLNAFAAPGGYIYIYTGLMKYLDSEEQLAGVMGHELAHADRRHSSRQLTKKYGITTMLSVAFGNDPGLLTEVASGLLALKYSRNFEAEADEYSVKYLCSTEWEADGAADFFVKLEAESQGGSTPAFMSTHPDPANRIEDITALKEEEGCSGTATNEAAYQTIIAQLP